MAKYRQEQAQIIDHKQRPPPQQFPLYLSLSTQIVLFLMSI